ncbi:MAG: VCBS repeat-containing protein, partial [Pseudomonadota bacterium]
MRKLSQIRGQGVFWVVALLALSTPLLAVADSVSESLNQNQCVLQGGYFEGDLFLVSGPGITLRACAFQNRIHLRWTAPTDAGMPNNIVYIRRKEAGVPQNSSDGTEVYTGAALSYEDTDVTQDQIYYYRTWVNDGSPYAIPPVGGVTNVSATPDPGIARILLRNMSTGQLVDWRLLESGPYKSSAAMYNENVSTSWQIKAVIDINNDGAKDLIWQHSTTGGVYFWLMNADGYLASHGSIVSSVGSNWQIKGAGYLDNDNVPDLIWQNSANGRVYYWLLNSNGSLKSGGYVYNGDVASTWNIMKIIDMNNDGIHDIVWQHQTTGGLIWWELSSGGTLETYHWIYQNVASTWQLKGMGYIDGDGNPDILWQHSSTGQLYHWFLDSDGTIKSHGYTYESSISSAWAIQGLVDVNNDGTDDIVWRHSSSGGIYHWQLNTSGDLASHGWIYENMSLTWEITNMVKVSEPPDVTITAADSVEGTTTTYIGATEAYVFNIDDLTDLGINTFRMWTSMNELEWWDDDDATWGAYGGGMIGTPAIQTIKDDQPNGFNNTVPWSWWDTQFGGVFFSWDDPYSEASSSRAEIIDACISNQITPLLVLRNKTNANEPAWAPDPAPLTAGDLAEWWEHCFATAYWLNVRNPYSVVRFEVLNEPDYSGQGWTENGGTKEDYVPMIEQAYDAVKFANDIAGISTIIHAPVVASYASDYIHYSLSNADTALVDRIQVVDYHTYDNDPTASINHVQADIATYNPDGNTEPIWVSEWGALWATYDTEARALLTADQLMTFSQLGVEGVTIFNLYDWWQNANHGLIRHLGDGSWAKTETYYAFRLMIRGLINGKDIVQSSTTGSPGRVM